MPAAGVVPCGRGSRVGSAGMGRAGEVFDIDATTAGTPGPVRWVRGWRLGAGAPGVGACVCGESGAVVRCGGG
jgi:hypothetical protein